MKLNDSVKLNGLRYHEVQIFLAKQKGGHQKYKNRINERTENDYLIQATTFPNYPFSVPHM